jgi:hypothetical protein
MWFKLQGIKQQHASDRNVCFLLHLMKDYFNSLEILKHLTFYLKGLMCTHLFNTLVTELLIINTQKCSSFEIYC